MNENYIVINGKRLELTKEQLKTLGIKVKKNPFDRVDGDDRHYYTIVGGDVLRRIDINDRTDRMSYNAVNYFNDGKFAEQVALHQLLYRKLLKFAYDNECEDDQTWNKINCHYYIGYNINEDRFYADVTAAFNHNDVWFSSRDSANHAIEEVIKPFMEEHPEFVW